MTFEYFCIFSIFISFSLSLINYLCTKEKQEKLDIAYILFVFLFSLVPGINLLIAAVSIFEFKSQTKKNKEKLECISKEERANKIKEYMNDSKNAELNKEFKKMTTLYNTLRLSDYTDITNHIKSDGKELTIIIEAILDHRIKDRNAKILEVLIDFEKNLLIAKEAIDKRDKKVADQNQDFLNNLANDYKAKNLEWREFVESTNKEGI